MNKIPGRICYDKLFSIAEEKGIKVCDLSYLNPSIPSDLFKRLRAGGTCRTNTIAALCHHLGCQPGDIMEYIPEEEDEATKS